MEISISEELWERIQWKVSRGLYKSSDDVIACALELLDEHDVGVAMVRDLVMEGVEDFRNGRYTVYTEETLDNLVDDVERRAKELRASRKESAAL